MMSKWCANTTLGATYHFVVKFAHAIILSYTVCMIIIFESHATTVDNEAARAAGWNDVALSRLGEQQAKQLGERYTNDTFAAIFCSDLQRSYKTAELAFGDKFPIIKDERLRECNYGDLSGAPKTAIEQQKVQHIVTPFPGGESYSDTSKRMKSFLDDAVKDYSDKKIMIIGHRATQYGLEVWMRGSELKDTVVAPWQWQPGWRYETSAGSASE